MEARYGLYKLEFHLPMLSWLTLLLGMNLSKQRLTLSHCGVIQEEQTATLWQVTYVEPLQLFKEQRFVLTGIDTFWVWIFFPCLAPPSLQCQQHSVLVYRMLIHSHVILHSIVSDQ